MSQDIDCIEVIIKLGCDVAPDNHTMAGLNCDTEGTYQFRPSVSGLILISVPSFSAMLLASVRCRVLKLNGQAAKQEETHRDR
jgi:hypothetical protein